MSVPKPSSFATGSLLPFLLVLLMTLRISTYFTLFPDSVAMTQIVKTAGRLFLTGTSALLLFRLRDFLPGYRLEFTSAGALGLYLAYLFLGILSVFWTSSVPYTLLQLSMVIEALVFAWFYYQLLLVYNVFSGNRARFSLVFGRAVAWISLAFLIGLLLDPATFYRETHGGEVSRLGGFIINPNELGMLAVLGAVMAYREWLGGRHLVVNGLVLGLCVAVLLLTQSRSSLGAFLLVTAITVLQSKRPLLILGSIAGAVVVLPILVQTIILKQGDVEEVMSMTGRLPFWKDLIAFGFTREPLLGYGFMRISYDEYFDSIHAYAAKMTHNTFIQVLLNLGLIGAFIVLLQMAATTNALIRSDDRELRSLASLMLIPLIINSMTEFGIFGESNYGIQFYQWVILFFTIRYSPSPVALAIQAKLEAHGRSTAYR